MGNRLAVLIVEDLESDAQLIVRLLKKAGYEVISKRVENAEQMRSELEKRTWDVVIADYSLPQFDGNAALALLKNEQQDIPFIVVSGTMGEETAVAMMKAGAHDYMIKGDLGRLVPAVKRELEQVERRRESKEAEQALRTSEEKYRTLIEQASDGIFITDRDNRYVEVNSAGCQLLGYTRSEILQLSIHDVTKLSPEETLRFKDLQNGKVLISELEMIRKDGTLVSVEIGTRQLPDGNLQGIVRDITERKQIENALLFLLQSGYSDENFFQSLARYLAKSLDMDYVCIDRLAGDKLSAETISIYFDGKFEDNVVYTLKDTPCGDVVGNTICVFPSQVRHLFPQDVVLQEMLAESYVGTTLWSSQGQPIGLIAVIGRKPLVNRSVAEAVLRLVAVRAAGELERKQAVDDLRESEAFTQAILENSPIGISVRSRTGQLLSANEAWKKIWAIPESDLEEDFTRERQSLNFDEQDDYLKFHQDELRNVFEQGGHLYLPELKTTHSRPGAAEWISQHFYAIQNAQGQVVRVVILTEDITERKLAHERIQESEERLAAVMEGSQLGYSDWNIQTGEILRNERWAEMLGYTLNEIKTTYKQWEDLIHPDDRAAALQATQDHLDGKTMIHRDEYRLRAKDGSYRWILDQGKIVEYDQQGHALRMTATHTDITERKQAEEALRESEARYRAVAHSANDAIISADSMGNIIGWNRGAEMIFGYSEAETMGQSLSMLIPSRNHKDHMAGLARVSAGEQPRVIGKTTEMEGLRKDGSEFPLELSLSQWQVANVQFYTAIIRDITERKQIEDQLRQLSRAVEQSPASIMITDKYGKIEYVNPKFTALNGYILDEVRGMTPRVLKSGTTPPEKYTELWQVILSGKEWHGEFLNRKKDGNHYWEYSSISAITDPHGNITHLVAVNEDITARKESEEKIRLLNIELERQALTDYLTNLYNRRYFMQRGAEEFKRANRSSQPLALLMLDIDEFKKVNDSYGHEAGDLSLQQVSVALKSSLRETDILGRMGGEEFAVLLPNTSLKEAFVLAERVRQTIADTSFETSSEALSISITICIGVAAFTDGMSNIDELLRNADAALFHAKHKGRNRVMEYKNF